MKPIFFSLFTLFLFQIGNAQDPYKIYKMESIYLYGNKFVKNDIQYPAGIFYSNLAKEMQTSTFTKNEWKKFTNLRNLSLATSLTGLGLTILGVQAQKDETQRDLILTGLLVSVVSIPISIKSQAQLQKAIWTRNRDLF